MLILTGARIHIDHSVSDVTALAFQHIAQSTFERVFPPERMMSLPFIEN